jgi:type VI secretion system protein ImpA
MASESILDFDRLLAPISDDNPGGADVRWEAVYQQIKDARPKDDRDAFGLDSPQIADWNPVVELTADAIASQSKDLMLAAWLAEALVHRHGFAGLRDGLKLINGLLENLWDGLYPRADQGDLEPRAAPLVFLTMDGRGARLPESLKDAPLTPDRDEIFCWSYWRARQPMPNEPVEAFNQRAAEVDEKTRKFDEAVGRVSFDFAKNLYEDVQQSQEELARLTKNLNEKFGEVAPGTTKLRASLEDCFVRVKKIFKDKGGLAEVSEAEGEGSLDVNGQPQGAASGPIRTREDAFRRLDEVAKFLRQKEPQSPIYLLVERAVAWSRMPFDQLIGELIKDSGARGQVGELLGIKPPAE